MGRDYKVRVPREIPEATSEAVAAWLDEAIEQGGRLAADPGGGPAKISLSLDPAKVVALANKKRERVPVLLRRVIASHVKLEPVAAPAEEKSEAPSVELLPDRVLPRKLSYEAEDFLDFIRGIDNGLAFAYRRFYGLKELKPAETPNADRKLAGALAECVNRRAPAGLLANADLVKLGITSFRWSMAQTEDLDARGREAKAKAGTTGHRAAPIAIAMPEPEAPAEAAAPPEMPLEARMQPPPQSPAAAAGISPHELAHLDEPFQQEGDF